jgi:hypothetical protein
VFVRVLVVSYSVIPSAREDATSGESDSTGLRRRSGTKVLKLCAGRCGPGRDPGLDQYTTKEWNANANVAGIYIHSTSQASGSKEFGIQTSTRLQVRGMVQQKRRVRKQLSNEALNVFIYFFNFSLRSTAVL